MKKQRLLVLSLLLNALFIIGIGAIAFHKRDKIMEKVQAFLGTSDSPKEADLKAFNNKPLEAVNDSLMVGSDSTITCLFLGNSLTYHSVIDEEPAEGKRGLTATSVDKDYVHVLLKMISDNNSVNIKYSVLNIAQFERTFTKHSFSMEKILLAENKQPDFLFVQIGENVAKDDIVNSEKFEKEYCSLLSFFPNSTRIITIPFWPDKNKEYAITSVAIKTNSYLVDISHLGDGTDKMNYASSYKDYKQPGVGSHPGDYGMEKIANCIYATFNAILNN